MAANAQTTTDQAFPATQSYDRGAVAAWWLGAFMAALAILVIVAALSREPVGRGLPAPTPIAPLVAPAGMTTAISTPATPAATARTAPSSVRAADNAERAAINDENRTARQVDAQMPPPPIPSPAPNQPVRPF